MSAAEKVNPCGLQAGTVIGPYEVVCLVAAGGFGYLYKVFRGGKPYALKLGRERFGDLLPEDREYSRERLDREIAALASLRHPNIVRVHSFEFWPDLEGGYPYLVLDFVEGSHVCEWRAEDEPSLARICRVFEKIADALEHMHGLGIYHRDVKNENVLVRPDEEPIIVDFGIARPRVAHALTRAASVGTVTHYAPEYAVYCDSADCQEGRPFEWKPTVDLHAVGYLLYEVLTGRPPFRVSESEPANEIRILNAIKTMVPKRL